MGLDFNEELASAALQQEKVKVILDLKSGFCQATAWGCDLSHEYININAALARPASRPTGRLPTEG